MKLLVVGNGGREHAIAWKLRQSPAADEMFVAPGNAGTAQIANNVPIPATDIKGLLRFAQEREIDLTVVGPEAALAAGIADRFQEAGLAIFGPTQAAARIETSKGFAKRLMARHGVPTGSATEFDDFAAAREHVMASSPPFVIKADGLAAGKGVVVAGTQEEAVEALHRQMVEKGLGDAGERVLVEEHLEGQELSVFAFVDGERVSPMVAARDYKPVNDGDSGPNTGGMGAYSPPSSGIWTDELAGRVRREIMEPVAAALAQEGCPYRGVLYGGLMVTDDGPKVIEFNCRFGDPEAQVVLPRLKTDLLEGMIRTAGGHLEDIALEWDSRPRVGVVVASDGYPASYDTGYSIRGLDSVDEDVAVFHAGTDVTSGGRRSAPEVVTSGGRVLTVVALGDSIEKAREAAYANVERIRFKGAFYRRDIASEAVLDSHE